MPTDDCRFRALTIKIQLSYLKSKEWAQTSDKRCDYRLLGEFYLLRIDDEGKQSLRDEI